MHEERRTALKAGGGLTLLALLAAAGWLTPRSVRAHTWNKSAFETRGLGDTMKALGAGEPAKSSEIEFFQTPDIAENGAVVPIGITSKIPNTEAIAILVEKNPNMLAAVFEVPPGTEATIATRIKMAETCNVYALVRAEGKYFVTAKEVKVTLGGCGG